MKHILALLLVLALAVPFTVYATEPTTAPELETTVEPETVPETLVASYFLTPSSYVQAYATNPSGYYSAGMIVELGYINTAGVVTYGRSALLYYSTTTRNIAFYGLYYLPEYPAPDTVCLLPDNFTVAAGVAKSVPFWLTDSDGGLYNNPSIVWGVKVISPSGSDLTVDWASIGAASGVLSLTADSLPGYDIEVTASWGDGYSKSTTLFIRDLGDPGGSDPEIPDSSGEYEERISELESQVMTLYEQNAVLQEQVDEMPDRIAESMEQVLDQEKNEADQGGNENVGDLTDAIPDYSEGFMDALRDFASSMIYSGTDAVLPIPAIVFPEIGGLVPSFTLLEANSLDFGQVFQIVPDTVMKLVQALLTIALIVYCFKELYGTMSYVLTMRGGGA